MQHDWSLSSCHSSIFLLICEQAEATHKAREHDLLWGKRHPWAEVALLFYYLAENSSKFHRTGKYDLEKDKLVKVNRLSLLNEQLQHIWLQSIRT